MGWGTGGCETGAAPAGPGCVAKKDPGNEAKEFHDDGFNWLWRLVDLPWV